MTLQMEEGSGKKPKVVRDPCFDILRNCYLRLRWCAVHKMIPDSFTGLFPVKIALLNYGRWNQLHRYRHNDQHTLSLSIHQRQHRQFSSREERPARTQTSGEERPRPHRKPSWMRLAVDLCDSEPDRVHPIGGAAVGPGTREFRGTGSSAPHRAGFSQDCR